MLGSPYSADRGAGCGSSRASSSPAGDLSGSGHSGRELGGGGGRSRRRKRRSRRSWSIRMSLRRRIRTGGRDFRPDLASGWDTPELGMGVSSVCLWGCPAILSRNGGQGPAIRLRVCLWNGRLRRGGRRRRRGYSDRANAAFAPLETAPTYPFQFPGNVSLPNHFRHC